MKKTLKELFGVESAREQEVAVPGPFTPKIHPEYQFRPDLLKIVLYWLFSGQQQNLYIHGPTGAGKSSLIEETAARLGLQVFKVSCHSRTEYPEFTGLYIKGGHEYVEGPLVRAMKEGGIFLMDEADQLNPSAAMGTNAALDGNRITVAETGEVIEPHPNFRVAMTGNSAGSGDRNRIYKGVTAQNPAWLDRSLSLVVDYMSPEQELKALLAAEPGIGERFGEAMIEIASEVRGLFKAVAETGMNHTISTRTLVRWAQLAVAFSEATEQPIMDALAPAFLNRLDHDQAEAVLGICRRILGKPY